MSNGRISIEVIAKGMSVCLSHGAALSCDARALQNASRAGPAAVLGGLALEELGKIYVLRKMVIFAHNHQSYWRACWKEFNGSHSVKAAFSMHDVSTGVLHSAEALQENANMFEKLEDIAIRNRERFMYVDYDWSRREWHSPEVISLEESGQVVLRAEHQLEEHRMLNKIGAHSPEFLRQLVSLYKKAVRLKAAEEKRRGNRVDLSVEELMQLPCWVEWTRSMRAESSALLGLVEIAGSLTDAQSLFLRSWMSRVMEDPGKTARSSDE